MGCVNDTAADDVSVGHGALTQHGSRINCILASASCENTKNTRLQHVALERFGWGQHRDDRNVLLG